jgi:hypothetical protein
VQTKEATESLRHLSFGSGLSMKSPSFSLNKIGKATGELVGETFLSYTAITLAIDCRQNGLWKI